MSIPNEILTGFLEGLLNQEDQIDFIETYLVSDEDRHIMLNNKTNISNILHGKYNGNPDWIEEIFKRWNTILGSKVFKQ